MNDESQRDFISVLMEDFPSLFPQDEKGNAMRPVCWSGVPVGWEKLVYNLCGFLDSRKNNYRFVRKKDFKSRLLFLRDRIARKILFHYSYRILDPYRAFQPKECRAWTITREIQDKVSVTWKYKLREKLGNIKVKYFNYDGFEKVYPPKITIEQIKEKYGTLRFYFSGGDDTAEGAVSFAEYLSSVTCEETGEKAHLYKKHGYYRTLSPAKAEEHGYTKCSES